MSLYERFAVTMHLLCAILHMIGYLYCIKSRKRMKSLEEDMNSLLEANHQRILRSIGVIQMGAINKVTELHK